MVCLHELITPTLPFLQMCVLKFPSTHLCQFGKSFPGLEGPEPAQKCLGCAGLGPQAAREHFWSDDDCGQLQASHAFSPQSKEILATEKWHHLFLSLFMAIDFVHLWHGNECGYLLKWILGTLKCLKGKDNVCSCLTVCFIYSNSFFPLPLTLFWVLALSVHLNSSIYHVDPLIFLSSQSLPSLPLRSLSNLHKAPQHNHLHTSNALFGSSYSHVRSTGIQTQSCQANSQRQSLQYHHADCQIAATAQFGPSHWDIDE